MKRRPAADKRDCLAQARIESEAAFKVSLLLRRELGLSPCDSEAELRGALLAVRLRQALTPMGRIIARAEGGSRVLQGAYDVLHEFCRERLQAQVARIVGLPVRRSRIEVDARTEDVFVLFELGLPSGPGREIEDA